MIFNDIYRKPTNSVFDLGFIVSSFEYILRFWFAGLPGNWCHHRLWITAVKQTQCVNIPESLIYQSQEPIKCSRKKKKGPWEVLMRHNDYNHSYSCKCGFTERCHLMIVSRPCCSLSLGLKAELGHRRLALRHQDKSVSKNRKHTL